MIIEKTRTIESVRKRHLITGNIDIKEWFKTNSFAPLFLLILIGIVFRIFYFTHLQSYTISTDTNSYVNAMNTIFLGKVDKLRPPLYPIFLGIMRTLFGTGYMLAAVNFQTVFALISIVFFYLSSAMIFKNKIIIYCATILYGIMPQILNWERALIPESLAISGTVVFFFVLLKYLKKPTIKLAFLIGVICFLFVMLKPAFILYSAIIFLFWILRFLFHKQEIKQNLVGLLSIVMVFLLLKGYCYLNEKDNGYNGISIVGSNLNQVFMLMDNNMYQNANYPDIENKIDELKTNSPYTITWDQMLALNTEVEPQLLTEYANSTIKQHIPEYIYYSVKKFALLAKEPLSIGRYAERINTHWEVITDSLMFFLFPFTFLHLYVLILAEFFLALKRFLQQKKFPWISLGLIAFLLGQLVVAVVGAMSDWQRLIVNVFPFILILFLLYIDRFMDYLQSRALVNQE